MNKKYIPGIVVALIAVLFAGFVAFAGTNKASDTKDVKGVQTAENDNSSDKKTPPKADAKVETGSDGTVVTTDLSVTNTENAATFAFGSGTPADQRNPRGGIGGGDAFSIVTKPQVVVPATAPAPVPAPAPTPAPSPAPAPAGTNLVANPSVEESSNGLPVAWTAGGYGNNTATTTYAATGHSGNRSLLVETSAYTDGDAKWVSNPIPVTAGKTYQVSNYYKSTGVSQVDAAFIDSSGVITYTLVGNAAATADWSAFSGQFTAPAGAASVIIFHALTSVGSLQTDDYAVTEGANSTPTPAPVPTPVPIPTPTPTPAPQPSIGSGFNSAIVSLTFDDGWASIHDNALPALVARGLVSTQYLNSEPISAGFDGYMSTQDVVDFVANGHELAWHTRTHTDLTSLSTADVATELDIPEDFLASIGMSRGAFQNVATPLGAYNASVVAQVRAQYGSHRSTDGGYNTKSNFSRDNIRVQNIVNSTTAAQIQEWVTQAVADKSWLVLLYHEVSDDPVDPDPTYTAGVAAFQSHLDVVSAAKNAGAAKVLTVEQALAEIQPQL